jgi:predicted dienelactone hydrolase
MRLAVAVLGVASLAFTPWLCQADEPSRGPLTTSAVDLVLTLADAPARGESSREIPIKVRYPLDATGPLPLVIFSHGMGGSFEAFDDLTDGLASHGYVVILPTHSDSVKLRREQGAESGREILSNPAAYVRNLKVLERVDDIKRIIDAIPVIETKAPDLTKAGATISRDAIAMAGHSAGALTTQMVIGAKVRTRLLGGVESVADPRVKAGVVISGQGLKTRLFTEESWAKLDKPMLVITGSRDTSRVGSETPASRRHPFEYAPASTGEPQTFLLWIDGATHSSYSGKSAALFLGERPEDPAMVAAVTSSAVLPFLDAFVKHPADSAPAQAARGLLTNDAIAKQSGGKAKLTSK